MNIKNVLTINREEDNLLVIDEYEFKDIAAEFINHEEYIKLGMESHHGDFRLKHSFRVAKVTYTVAKTLGLDYKSATRAAFLHDFFFNQNIPENMSALKKAKLHPEIALINSRKYFNINEIEADSIVNHMYPLTSSRPESKEGLTLSMVDKGVAIVDRFSSIGDKVRNMKVLTKKTNVLLWIMLLYNKISF